MERSESVHFLIVDIMFMIIDTHKEWRVLVVFAVLIFGMCDSQVCLQRLQRFLLEQEFELGPVQ